MKNKRFGRLVAIEQTTKNNRSAWLCQCGGVYVRNRRGTRKYQAFINVNKKPKYLGTFDTIEEAAKVRKQSERDFWGK